MHKGFRTPPHPSPAPGQSPDDTSPSPAPASALIIDHTTTDLSLVPDEWLEAARERVAIVYAAANGFIDEILP